MAVRTWTRVEETVMTVPGLLHMGPLTAEHAEYAEMNPERKRFFCDLA